MSPSLKRWIGWSGGAAVAAVGLTVAFVWPSSAVPDCPYPGGPPTAKCFYTTDTHAWLRLLIGGAGLMPALLMLGRRGRGGPIVAVGIWVAAATSAILVGTRTGPIEGGGDCPFYPRCYGEGHPYIVLAVAIILAATPIAAWLWDKRARSTEQRKQDVTS